MMTQVPSKNENELERPWKVLVVDDEPFMLQAWRRILEEHRCEIRTLSDGSELMELVEAWRPDVTLLDIRLPGVSGIDLLRDIKERSFETEVVMMTAFATVETAVEAVKRAQAPLAAQPGVGEFAGCARQLRGSGRFQPVHEEGL